MIKACANWFFVVCGPMAIGIAVATERPLCAVVLFVLGAVNMVPAGRLLDSRV